jgi:predicted MFS family arabinose efflux permease
VLVALTGQNFGWILAAFVPPVVAAVVAIGMWKWAKRDAAEQTKRDDEE